MSKAESLLAYFEDQRAHYADKLQRAVLGCDKATAKMWLTHYEKLCAKMMGVS